MARTTLKHQEIAHANVMGGDSNGIGSVACLDRRPTRCWFGWTTTAYGNVNLFPIMVVMTMTSTDDAFSSTVKTMCERVVMT